MTTVRIPDGRIGVIEEEARWMGNGSPIVIVRHDNPPPTSRSVHRRSEVVRMTGGR